MILILFGTFLVIAAICLVAGIKLGDNVGIFLFFIGAALLIATGALISVEGLQIEEQAVIQDAPDTNAGAKVINFSYTSYTAENSTSIQVLSLGLFGIGIFFILMLILGAYS